MIHYSIYRKLGSCWINGTVPSWLNQLETLDISNNQFSGRLPLFPLSMECNAIGNQETLCYPKGGNPCGLPREKECK